jgi:hypothetical protein
MRRLLILVALAACSLCAAHRIEVDPAALIGHLKPN